MQRGWVPFDRAVLQTDLSPEEALNRLKEGIYVQTSFLDLGYFKEDKRYKGQINGAEFSISRVRGLEPFHGPIPEVYGKIEPAGSGSQVRLTSLLEGPVLMFFGLASIIFWGGIVRTGIAVIQQQVSLGGPFLLVGIWLIIYIIFNSFFWMEAENARRFLLKLWKAREIIFETVQPQGENH